HGLGAALHLAGPRGVGADRLDAYEVLEVGAEAGEEFGDAGAELFSHARHLNRAPWEDERRSGDLAGKVLVELRGQLGRLQAQSTVEAEGGPFGVDHHHQLPRALGRDRALGHPVQERRGDALTPATRVREDALEAEDAVAGVVESRTRRQSSVDEDAPAQSQPGLDEALLLAGATLDVRPGVAVVLDAVDGELEVNPLAPLVRGQR